MESSGLVQITANYYFYPHKVIGKGNFGIVYQGYSKKLNSPIAVKHVSINKWLKYKQYYQRQLIQLTQIAKYNHPNLMLYIDNQKNSDGVYFFLQLCQGGNISKKAGRINQKQLINIFGQLLDGICFLHSKKKLHRDIKPQNILLDKHGNIKIGDFGLLRDDSIFMTNYVCSPTYAAPQIFKNNGNYDQRCDIWSLGALLYQMVNGVQLIPASQYQQICKQFKKIQNLQRKIQLNTNFNKQWQLLLNQMLTYNWLKRPNCQEIRKRFLILKQTVQKSQIQNLKIYESIMVERSAENIKNITSTIQFLIQKSELALQMIRKLMKTNLKIGNVAKYIIMFIAECYIISRKNIALDQIKSQKLSTVHGPIYFINIHPSHSQQLQLLIKNYIEKLTKDLKKHQETLHQQACKKLRQYLTRKVQGSIIKNISNFQNQIEKAQQKQYELYTDYLQMFQKVAGLEIIKKSNQEVQKMDKSSLEGYMWIRLICHLDQIFPDLGAKTQGFIREKLKSIQQKSELDKIAWIKTKN